MTNHLIPGITLSKPPQNLLKNYKISMIQQIKKEIEKQLGNIYEFDYNSIKSNLENILIQYHLYDSIVVCDNTNNPPRQIKNKNECIAIDVHLKPIKSIQYITINIVIQPDRIRALKKLRKAKIEKLEKINVRTTSSRI